MEIGELQTLLDVPLPSVSREPYLSQIKTMEAMPLAQAIGVDVLGLAPGSAVLRMAFKVETTFDGRSLMGGIAGTFADMAAVSAAVAERGPGWFGSTTHFTTNLIAPGIGDCYIAIGKTIGSSGSTTTASAEVFAIKGKKATIIASCMASAKMIQLPQKD